MTAHIFLQGFVHDTGKFISAKEVTIPAQALPVKAAESHAGGLWEKREGHQGLGMYRSLPVIRKWRNGLFQHTKVLKLALSKDANTSSAHMGVAPYPKARARL